jgi:hypothetical protein
VEVDSFFGAALWLLGMVLGVACIGAGIATVWVGFKLIDVSTTFFVMVLRS